MYKVMELKSKAKLENGQTLIQVELRINVREVEDGAKEGAWEVIFKGPCQLGQKI